MSTFEPVARPAIAADIIRQVQQAMAEGSLKRGDRLPPEPELAKRFQVSRGALREALKILEVLGILEVRRGSGTFVSETPRLPTVDPMLFLLLLQDGTQRDLIDFRLMVEVGFTKLAQSHVRPDLLERLRGNIEAMRTAIADGSVTDEHDLSFHRIILEATGNPFVVQVGTTVLELFRASIGKGVQTYPEYALRHHEAILEALGTSDPIAVENAVGKSYEVWRDLLGA